MSYTLTVEPDVVRTAETFANKRGTSLEAILRAYLLAFVRTETAITRNQVPPDSTVGALTGIIKPTHVSDEEMIASAILDKYGTLA